MNDRERKLQVVRNEPAPSAPATEYHVVRDDPDRPTTAHARTDRRKFARHSLALRVQLRFESLDAAVHSQSVDLSRSGIFLRTSIVRPLGTAVQLRFDLDASRLDISGVVVRYVMRDGKRLGMGIAFDEPIAADAGIFDALIEQHAALAGR
ncbi:MAG TPA: PilZ domain-containing protein [Nannocystaceae bacterium]|nr:PilZ domain-containing protein [Nannocystaceae bacterium]